MTQVATEFAKTSGIEIGTVGTDVRYENPLYMIEGVDTASNAITRKRSRHNAAHCPNHLGVHHNMRLTDAIRTPLAPAWVGANICRREPPPVSPNGSA
jgi:hypothetical protein